MDHDAWLAIREAIAKPWPEEAWRHDLTVWQELAEHHEVPRPSAAALARAWGCDERTVRRRLSDAPGQRRVGAGSAPGLRRVGAGLAPGPVQDERPEHAASAGLAPGERRVGAGLAPGERRVDVRVAPESDEMLRLFEPEEGRRKKEEEQEEEEPHTQCADAHAAPPWARGVRGAKPSEVVEGVAAIVSAIRGQPTAPAKTTAAPVLALYRAAEVPWPAFVADALLVADAAHRCPDRLFARDLRAEGWADGTDRRRDVAAVLRHARWQARLDAARAWDASGRPTGSRKIDQRNLHKSSDDFDLSAYVAAGGEVF